MAKFYQGNELNAALEKLVREADQFLYLISPFIKLHRRFKDELIAKRDQNPHLHIIVVFGKNEEDISRSVEKDDITFLRGFPNITIAYEKDLHAKFYATEDRALITSLNLHLYSQNNNIEAGVMLEPQSTIKKLSRTITNTDILPGDDSYHSALDYFQQVINRSKKLFVKKAHFEPQLLGLLKPKYTWSEVMVDELDATFFKGSANARQSRNQEGSKPPPFNHSRNSFRSESREEKSLMGYCIRTGMPIDYNPAKPMSYDAYFTWAQFGNWDYPENYCHATGQPSRGKTSMRYPILSGSSGF